MDIKQIHTHNKSQNEKNPSKFPNKDQVQQEIVYNLLNSVKESENFGNSVNKKLHEETEKNESPKKSQFFESISPIPNNTLVPLKSSLKISSQKTTPKNNPSSLLEIFKKDEYFGSKHDSQIKNRINEIVLQEPQSGYSSHISISPIQKSSFNRVLR